MNSDMLLTALRQMPKHTQDRPNLDPNFAGKDSFLLFLDMGFRTPLEVVIVQDENTYYIVRVFFPEVYRY